MLYSVGSCISGFRLLFRLLHRRLDCRLCADAWLAGTEMLTGSWARAGGSL